MKHLNPLNSKARRLTRALEEVSVEPGLPPRRPEESRDVVALTPRVPQQPQGPHIPTGCSTVFAPGWEVDRTGGTAGLCQPVERDLFDCHLGCFWPAQVPDQLNHAPDWTKKCAAAQKDWRKIDVIFP